MRGRNEGGGMDGERDSEQGASAGTGQCRSQVQGIPKRLQPHSAGSGARLGGNLRRCWSRGRG